MQGAAGAVPCTSASLREASTWPEQRAPAPPLAAPPTIHQSLLESQHKLRYLQHLYALQYAESLRLAAMQRAAAWQAYGALAAGALALPYGVPMVPSSFPGAFPWPPASVPDFATAAACANQLAPAAYAPPVAPTSGTTAFAAGQTCPPTRGVERSTRAPAWRARAPAPDGPPVKRPRAGSAPPAAAPGPASGAFEP
jgi:hypothetical protein